MHSDHKTIPSWTGIPLWRRIHQWTIDVQGFCVFASAIVKVNCEWMESSYLCVCVCVLFVFFFGGGEIDLVQTTRCNHFRF